MKSIKKKNEEFLKNECTEVQYALYNIQYLRRSTSDLEFAANLATAEKALVVALKELLFLRSNDVGVQ